MCIFRLGKRIYRLYLLSKSGARFKYRRVVVLPSLSKTKKRLIIRHVCIIGTKIVCQLILSPSIVLGIRENPVDNRNGKDSSNKSDTSKDMTKRGKGQGTRIQLFVSPERLNRWEDFSESYLPPRQRIPILST